MIGVAALAPENPWCTWWFVALFVVSTSVLLLGLLGLSHESLGSHDLGLSLRRNATHDALSTS
jgi:hypothetical protein